MVSQNELIQLLDHPKVLQDYANNLVFDRNALIKEVMYAVQAIQDNSILQNADAKTVLQCCFNVNAAGLTLNPVMGFAALVPFKGKCKVMPMYKGLAHLVFMAGQVRSIVAQVVHEKDTFRVNLADTQNPVLHETGFFARGKAVGVYAIATLANGIKQVEMMDREEIEAIRGSSEDYKYKKSKGNEKDAIWTKHEFEMWRKTVIKRIIKYLPKNQSGYEKLSKAIQLDNDVLDYDLPVSLNQMQDLDLLLHRCTLQEEQFYQARLELDSVKTQSQYRVLKAKLLTVQPMDLDKQLDEALKRN